MSSENNPLSLASLLEEYGGEPDCPVHLIWDPRVLAENVSVSGSLLEALLRGGFHSGKTPVAFESIVKNGSGKVNCDVLVNGHAVGLYSWPTIVKLNFTADKKGGLRKLVAKLHDSLRWEERLNSKLPEPVVGGGEHFVQKGNVVMKHWRREVDISVILKRTQIYLAKPHGSIATTQGMKDYYHWMWCLLSEKDLDQDLVRHIAEFLPPPPIFWLQEGDFVAKTGRSTLFVRPRVGV